MEILGQDIDEVLHVKHTPDFTRLGRRRAAGMAR
jgi:hypothetical protein